MPSINELKGFSKLNYKERLDKLKALNLLSEDDILLLSSAVTLDVNLAERFIENVLGYFQLPMGVAVNININKKDYVIPMAVEETSIIAALGKTAKWIATHGEISTSISGDCIIGQIQIPRIKNLENLSQALLTNKETLIHEANEKVALSMVKRGGGVKDLRLRVLDRPDGGQMGVIHLLMNSCDAMGANIINQVLEFLKPLIEKLTHEQVNMCILSNLNDEKLTEVNINIHGVDPELGEKIQEASIFAEIDPWRASTSNKGIMNGIDPVLIATGNDWRAVEAGMHAYAARNGQYSSLSQWRYNNSTLTGTLKAPVTVGIVGGVTSLHPHARLSLKMMGIESADELSQVVAAVGLVQNLGAIRALCTDGIIQGHMKLHIDNLLMIAGATDDEMPLLKPKMQEWLKIHRRISLQHAQALIHELRHETINE